MNSQDTRARLRAHLLKLAEKRDIASNDAYWEAYWTLPKCAADVFEGITNSDIRTVASTRNFVKLIRVVALRLVHLATEETELDAAGILNCLRVLTRFLPFFYENPLFAKAETQIFWSASQAAAVRGRRTADSVAPTVGTADTASTFSNQDHDAASVEANAEFETRSEARSEKAEIALSDTAAPTGAQLVNAAVNLLFTRGFTVPSAKSRTSVGIEFAIWEPGIGLAGDPAAPQPAIDANRLEVLRFLCTLCSQCVYTAPGNVVTRGSRFLTVLVAAVPKLHILTLLSSLMNLACRCSRPAPENGLQLGNNTLNHLRALVCTTAVQLLALMLVYPLPKNDVDFLARTGIFVGRPYNAVRYYFGKLHKDSELHLLVRSLLDLLEAPMQDVMATEQSSSISSMIKSKTQNVQPPLWGVEAVMLLWELYQCNKKFKTALVAGAGNRTGNRLVVLLLYNVFTFRKSELHLNFVRVCAYLLLLLTSDQLLLTALLQDFDRPAYDALPELFRISPHPITYRDFAVSKLCQILIYDDISIISPTLNECLFNLIPVAGVYDAASSARTENRRNSSVASADATAAFKSPGAGLSYSTCTSISQLMIKYSGHKFLTDDEANPDYLAFLMRAMCHAVCRFPRQNRNLIFVVAKNVRYLENISVTIENATADVGTDEEANGDAQNGAPNGAGSGTAAAPDNASAENRSIHSMDEGDPKYTSYRRNTATDMSSIDEEDEASEVLDSALRPKPPTGMSVKAKGKVPMDAPLKRAWTGHTPFSILLGIISDVRERVAEFDTLNKVDTALVLNKIENLDLDALIAKSAKAEYIGSKTNLEQLKFVWTNLSLGWYESILWGTIFASNETVSRRYTKTISLNSTISTFSKVSSDWGFGRWSNSESDTLDAVNRSLISVNIWYGTRIKLFKTDKFSAQAKGNFSEQLMRRISDFKLNAPPSSTAPAAPPQPSRQNSTVSVNSTAPSTPTIQNDDYFGDAVMSIKVTPRATTHRLSVSSNLNSPRNLTRSNSTVTTPTIGSPRSSIAL